MGDVVITRIMQKMKRSGRNGVWVILGSLALAGCDGGDAKKHAEEMDAVVQEVESLKAEREHFNEVRASLKEKDEEISKLRQEVAELQSKNRAAESALAKLEKEEADEGDSSDGIPPKRVSNDEKAKKVMPAAVTIQGDVNSGNGLLVRLNGATYLYTAAHAVSGNSKITVTNAEGKQFSGFGSIECAEGYDLVRIQLTGDVSEAVEVADFSQLVLKRSIILGGRSGTSGVMAGLISQVTAVGPVEFEVGTSITKGNTGSPVFDGETGTAFGVVTRVMVPRDDLWASNAKSGAGKARRFAVRLDAPLKWHKQTPAEFLNEVREIEKFDNGTKLVVALSKLPYNKNGVALNTRVGNATALDILKLNENQAGVREFMAVNTAAANQGPIRNDKETAKKFLGVYQQLLSGSQRQARAFSPASFSPYHRADAQASLKWRLEAEKALAAVIEEIPR
jgi:hypothetical protein